MKNEFKPEYKFINLPLTRLHYLVAGQGEPLIIVPATISSIDNWLDIVYFMSQKFQVFFFELPGHGQSTPFSGGYSSCKTAQSIGHFIDALGYVKVNIMGFSFGGILTLTAVDAMPDRINRVILFAPCVSNQALKFSPNRIMILKEIDALCKSKKIQTALLLIMHNPRLVSFLVKLLCIVGRVEKTTHDALREKLLTLPESTLDVLVSQMHEILTADFQFQNGRFSSPCFFGMSKLDPLLDYTKTFKFISSWFPNLKHKEFLWNFHQPPEPFSKEQLNSIFAESLNQINEYQ